MSFSQSSNLPIKGDTYVAPHFAANRACPGEKINVQFVFILLLEK